MKYYIGLNHSTGEMFYKWREKIVGALPVQVNTTTFRVKTWRQQVEPGNVEWHEILTEKTQGFVEGIHAQVYGW